MRYGLTEGSDQSTPPENGLPATLRFLLGRGFSAAELSGFAREAAISGVTADRHVLATGVISESVYYRNLALALDLPFARQARLSSRTPFPESARAGIAPLANREAGFLIAPEGAALEKLLELPRSGDRRLVVTTPSSLRRAVLLERGGAIAHQAAHALPERHPDLSSRDGWNGRQIAALCAILLVLLLSLAAGRHIPLVLLASAAGPVFLGMVVIRLASCLLPNPVAPAILPARMSDTSLPLYTIIAALYREGAVLDDLIAALDRLDYPKAKLDIILVIEADDRETQAALARRFLPGHISVIVAPPGFPRTKPRALNIALPLARGDFTVIYDADDAPDPSQLRLAAAFFRRAPPETACLQARLTIDNTRDSWLTRMFTIEYAALFDVLNPGLATIGSPVLLGGTSNHFRTETLRSVCGWDAWNVTEDADLGIRLARLGYAVADLPSSTLEEAPATLKGWMNQRTRWMKGFIQTSIAHSRHPLRTYRQLGLWRSYGAIIGTVGAVLSALFYPLFTAFAALLLRETPVTPWHGVWRAFSLSLFAMGFLALHVPALVALARRGLWELLPWICLLPAYYLLVSVAAWRSLWEFLRSPFRWNKTEHGLARTSRTLVRSTRRAPRERGR